MYKKTHYLLLVLYCLFFLWVGIFGSNVGEHDALALKEQLKSMLKKDKNIDITQDILDLNFTQEKFNNTKLDVVTWHALQNRINFSAAYDKIFQEKTDSAIDVKELYHRILRFSKNYCNAGVLVEAQQILNFVFNYYSKEQPFVHAISKAMLGGGFLSHVRLLRKEAQNNQLISNGSAIIPFIISAKKLLDILEDEQKQKFLAIFGTIKIGEQSITQKNDSSSEGIDVPQKQEGVYVYQKTVTDYLRALRKYNTRENEDITSLVGWYFLRLYFTGSSVLPEGTLGGFIEKNQGFILMSKLESLKNCQAKKDIEVEVLKWKVAFEKFKNGEIIYNSSTLKTNYVEINSDDQSDDTLKDNKNLTNEINERRNNSKDQIVIDYSTVKDAFDTNNDENTKKNPGLDKESCINQETDDSPTNINHVNDDNDDKLNNSYLKSAIFISFSIIVFFIYQYRDYFKTWFEHIAKTDENNKITDTSNK